jgi:hypothetical protein
MLATIAFTEKSDASKVLPLAERQQVAGVLEDDARMMRLPDPVPAGSGEVAAFA